MDNKKHATDEETIEFLLSNKKRVTALNLLLRKNLATLKQELSEESSENKRNNADK